MVVRFRETFVVAFMTLLRLSLIERHMLVKLSRLMTHAGNLTTSITLNKPKQADEVWFKKEHFINTCRTPAEWEHKRKGSPALSRRSSPGNNHRHSI